MLRQHGSITHLSSRSLLWIGCLLRSPQPWNTMLRHRPWHSRFELSVNGLSLRKWLGTRVDISRA